MTENKIKIKGAKVHNLKNVDLELPRDKFIVFTGLSGSGKSSLAFDTIYAEGQRRYMESLSSYARQFLGQMDKPDVESIEGLSPAISIDQKTTSHNPRSTVGTTTEIYDYLRLLYANIGVPHCPKCGKPIESMTVDQMADHIMEMEEGTKFMVLAPVVRDKKGTHKDLLDRIKKDGYSRVIVDGEILTFDEEISLEKNKRHNIDIVVDRLIIRDSMDSRLVDSIELALKEAGGLLVIDTMDGNRRTYNSSMTCIECGISYDEITPRLFSFNAPFGACETCKGIGFSKKPDIRKIIPNMDESISSGAIKAYSTQKGTYYFSIFQELAKLYNFDPEKPLSEAPKEFIDALLYGTDQKIKFKFDSHYSGLKTYNGPFEGIINNLDRRYHETTSDFAHEKLDEYMTELPCPSCHGKRLKPEVLSILIDGKSIIDFTDLNIGDELDFITNLELSEKDKIIAEQIVKEIRNRLQFLLDVGLGYLNLSRMTGTLSGGEAQRIRLATQIGSKLVGVTYVLDEPSIGLHQRDNNLLIATLRELTDLGNTLIVVEHDEDTMKACDLIVDIGPGAGQNGGEIIEVGSISKIKRNKRSITGQYLSGKRKIEVPKSRREGNGKSIKIFGARENNLKNIDVEFPLGKLISVTGVSGSGKSSLVNEVLGKRIWREFNNPSIIPGEFDKIEGIENIDKIVLIDQSPIGRTPRSNPATYTGVFDIIRDVFAATNEAKAKGYKKGRFSFNVKGGRCEACKGDGIIKVEMHFLSDVYVPCEVCGGKRYNRETLAVKYKGKNIYDVLNMTVDEALEFFEAYPRLVKKLQTLKDVGLGYIKIGQPSTQLSGGEAQRIKLATELSKLSTGKTLYILDEPTTGLHSEDINNLVKVLNRLVDTGSTIVVIEHNLDVIKSSDYVIDLGPEGGEGGGTIIATGTPEEIAEVENSYTGEFLKKILND